MRTEHIATHTREIRSTDQSKEISEGLFRCLKGFQKDGWKLIAFQTYPDGTTLVLGRDCKEEILRNAHSAASHDALREVGDATGKDKEKHFEFLRAYRRRIQELVASEICREGGTQEDVDSFWGNEMAT